MNKIHNCYADRIKASDPKQNIWVSASAGSGKTSLLINRILRILLLGGEADKILAITFTNAAADEIKERINDKLLDYQNLSIEKLTEELNYLLGSNPDKHIIEIAQNLHAKLHLKNQQLNIQTIHSFCLNLLTKYSLEAGLNLGFKIANAHQQEKILKLARDELFTDVAADELLERLVNLLTLEQLTEVFAEISDKRAQILYLLFKVNNRHEIGEFLAQKLGLQYKELSELESAYKTKIDFSLIAKFCQSCLNFGSNKEAKIASEVSEINAIADFPTALNLAAKLFLTKDFSLKKNLMTKALRLAINDASAIEEQAQHVASYFQHKQNLEIYRDSEAIISLATLFIDIHARLKAESNLLDYDDIILKTLRLLVDNNDKEWVLYSLRNEIKYLLLDEAQDTSPMQWDIIKELIYNLLDKNQDFLQSIFIVGDEKQSIFSFQNADFLGYHQNYQELKEYLQEQGQDFYFINLQNSFRSNALILNFVDEVFRYNYQDLTNQNSWQNHKAVNKTEEHAEIIIFPETEFIKTKYVREPWSLPQEVIPKVTESQDIAKQIIEFIKVKHQEKNIAYADIMILVRNRNQLYHDLVNELVEAKISFGVEEVISLNEHIIFHDLLSLTAFVIDKYDDYNLASLLKSPFFRVSEEELFAICHAREERKIYDIIKSNYAEIWQKLQEIEDILLNNNYLDAYLLLLADFELIQKYYAEFSELEAEKIIQGFKEELFNAEAEIILTYHGLYNYLTETNKKIKLSSKAKDKSSLITMHAAKGLQAKLVVIADANFNLSKAPRDKFFVNDELLLSNIGGYKNSLKDELKEAYIKLNYQENLRLLYVALTRAEDRLYIFAKQNSHGFISNLKNAAENLNFLEQDKFLLLGQALPYEGEIQISDDRSESIAINESVLNQTLGQEAELNDSYEQYLGNFMHEIWQKLLSQDIELKLLAEEIEQNLELKSADKIIYQNSLNGFADLEFINYLRNDFQLKTEVGILYEAQIFRLDVLAYNAEKMIILELKTGKDNEEMQIKHLKQLNHYHKIIKEIMPDKQIESYLIYLHNNKIIQNR